MSGLKGTFHLDAYSEIYSNYLCSSLAEMLWSFTTENRDVSSARSFTVDLFFPDKSLYTKKNKAPKMDLCSTPALTGNQFDDCLLSITY